MHQFDMFSAYLVHSKVLAKKRDVEYDVVTKPELFVMSKIPLDIRFIPKDIMDTRGRQNRYHHNQPPVLHNVWITNIVTVRFGSRIYFF